jgi:lipopolysaccharide exporter
VTLVRDTARGALFTISAGTATRGIGLIGTLLVTRFITPGEYGEVMVAAVLAATASQLSTFGFGQYLVATPDAGRAIAFHATVFHVLLGGVALALLLAVVPGLARMLDVPGLGRLLPGLALAALLERISFVPERILVRDLRFGIVSVMRTAGDLAHTVVSVWLAAIGWGAMAIVVGNVARSLTRLVVSVAAVERRDWLEPCRLSLQKTRELLAFGLPIALGAASSFAARRWDNLLVARFFGASTTGMYNLAYNLADVPAIQVGEQVGDVLLPSFARLDPERRPGALVRSLGLLALLVFPLAVGLGAVAPTLVDAVFDPRWQSVAPMLILLSALSVTRPVSWTIASYLQARHRPRTLMWLELGKVLLLVVAIYSVGRANVLFTCAAVGVTYGIHMLASLYCVRRIDGVALSRSLRSLAPALLACAPMVAAVLGTRQLLAMSTGVAAFLRLGLEVLAGGLVYLVFAWIFAPRSSRDLLLRVSEALHRAKDTD